MKSLQIDPHKSGQQIFDKDMNKDSNFDSAKITRYKHAKKIF